MTAYRELSEPEASANYYPWYLISLPEEADAHILHCCYRHAHDALLHDAAEQFGGRVAGRELQPYARCSMKERLCKAMPSTTSSGSVRKLQTVVVDLSGRNSVGSIGDSYYIIIVREDFIRSSWIHFLKTTFGASKEYEQFLGDCEESWGSRGNPF